MPSANTKPWYLTDLTEALYLDPVSGEVAIRTGINGNVNITGPVTIPGTVTVNSSAADPVHVHLDEVGTSGILTVPYMPIGGNVTVTGGNVNAAVTGNVIVTSGNINSVVTGTVGISGNIAGNVNANVTGGNIRILGNVNVTQGTSPWVISGNVGISNAATDLTLADSTYEMNVARGLIAGQIPVYRSGYNPDCSQNVAESIWVEGGIYPFLSWTVAQQLFMISTSAADTGQQILIEGLDVNYDMISETVTTAGTVAVPTVNNYIRIFTATIISADTPNAGEITFRLVNGTGTVVAHMRAGLCITKLSQYTIPAGYTGYIQYGDATTFRGGSGNIGTLLYMKVRPFGGTFLTVLQSEVVNGYYRNDFVIPLKITEKSDIDVQVFADSNNTVATCNWQLILIPN